MSNPHSSQPPTESEANYLFKIYRDYIKHEDNLVNHRTTWLITIQSFLWATFGFSYQKKYEIFARLIESGKDFVILKSAPSEYNGFLVLLAIVGLCTSVVSYLSVRAAADSINALRTKWESFNFDKNHLPKITGGGDHWASWFGILVCKGLPVLFALLWLITIWAIFSSNKIAITWSY